MITCPTCRDLQEERAAIHQFDGGATREQADELAWKVRCQKHQSKIPVDGFPEKRIFASFDSV